MKKTWWLLLVLLLCNFSLRAQQNEHHLRISVITCAPGNELYSIFGHTALRITDSLKQTDIVYNYGTFDFSDPDFYSKFTRGKLDYFLSISNLPAFLYEYQSEGRDVHEQVLAVTDSVAFQIQHALSENLAGPSRYYKYDFLYNNCTSRIRDILIRYAGMKVPRPLVTEGTSFRDMLHEYLEKGDQSWSRLGIDLVLGSPVDKKAGINESMFLPDYLMKGIDSSNSKHPVLKEKILLNKGNGELHSFYNEPLIIFSIVAGLIILLSFVKNRIVVKTLRIIDFLLLLVTGLTGCFLLFMWLGTDHAACARNANLLWALPTHLVAAIAFWKNPSWLHTYFRIFMLWGFAFLVLMWLIPQDINEGLFPVILLLAIRFSFLSKQRTHA